MNKNKKKVVAIGIYSAIIGIGYLVYGIIEMIIWVMGIIHIPVMSIPLSPSQDIFAGFVLLIIGLVLVYRIDSLLNMEYEGLSFLFVGLILSAIIGGMYILMIGADALDAAVVGESWEFDASTYNLPAIVLFILLLPAWLVMKYKDEFRSASVKRR